MRLNIEGKRKDKGKSQEEIAILLGITRQTYSKIEKGQVEPTVGQAVKLSEELGIGLEEFFGMDFTVKQTIETDLDKYRQIIQYFIKYGTTDNYKITKTKLAKLCYLADFTWYYYNLRSLTGLEYRKLPQGPVPDIFFRMMDQMEYEEDLVLEIVNKAHLISSLTPDDFSRLSEDELNMLQKIAEKWKTKDNKEIVNFTHAQLPWMLCNNDEIIPYSLITQEEAENVY